MKREFQRILFIFILVGIYQAIIYFEFISFENLVIYILCYIVVYLFDIKDHL